MNYISLGLRKIYLIESLKNLTSFKQTSQSAFQNTLPRLLQKYTQSFASKEYSKF